MRIVKHYVTSLLLYKQEETHFDNHEQSTSELSPSNFNLEYELNLSNRSLTDIAVKLGEEMARHKNHMCLNLGTEKTQQANIESPSLLSHPAALPNPCCIFPLNGCPCVRRACGETPAHSNPAVSTGCDEFSFPSWLHCWWGLKAGSPMWTSDDHHTRVQAGSQRAESRWQLARTY